MGRLENDAKKGVPSSVEVIIFSDNIGKGLHSLEYQDFCQEYPFRKITFQKSGGEFHDRYIIIDWNTEQSIIAERLPKMQSKESQA